MPLHPRAIHRERAFLYPPLPGFKILAAQFGNGHAKIRDFSRDEPGMNAV
jgi:hypothetical protein